MYLGLKEYRKALANWDLSLEVAPELPLAGRIQFQRGCVYLWLKDLLQAITCFIRSSELGSIRAFSSSSAQDAVFWARAWSTMCQAAPDLYIISHLEAIAAEDHYTGYICRGVIFFLQKEFRQALRALQHATTLHFEIDWYPDLWADFWREWDAHFWLAMVYLALDQEEEAHMAIEQALVLEMPPILLKPLCWFEQEKPKLYEQFVKPLLASYEV
jgi:tetratricopeptide (TPR) repeat protein